MAGRARVVKPQTGQHIDILKDINLPFSMGESRRESAAGDIPGRKQQ